MVAGALSVQHIACKIYNQRLQCKRRNGSGIMAICGYAVHCYHQRHHLVISAVLLTLAPPYDSWPVSVPGLSFPYTSLTMFFNHKSIYCSLSSKLTFCPVDAQLVACVNRSDKGNAPVQCSSASSRCSRARPCTARHDGMFTPYG